MNRILYDACIDGKILCNLYNNIYLIKLIDITWNLFYINPKMPSISLKA
jgi:hypothetical protein